MDSDIQASMNILTSLRSIVYWTTCSFSTLFLFITPSQIHTCFCTIKLRLHAFVLTMFTLIQCRMIQKCICTQDAQTNQSLGFKKGHFDDFAMEPHCWSLGPLVSYSFTLYQLCQPIKLTPYSITSLLRSADAITMCPCLAPAEKNLRHVSYRKFSISDC
jgi:hypothetical protein